MVLARDNHDIVLIGCEAVHSAGNGIEASRAVLVDIISIRKVVGYLSAYRINNSVAGIVRYCVCVSWLYL